MRKAFLAVAFAGICMLGACQSGDTKTEETEMTNERDSFSNSVLDKANEMFDSTNTAPTDSVSQRDTSVL